MTRSRVTAALAAAAVVAAVGLSAAGCGSEDPADGPRKQICGQWIGNARRGCGDRG